MLFARPISLALLAFGFFAAWPLAAQLTRDQESYPQVNAVKVEFSGQAQVSEQFVRNNIQLRQGMDYNPSVVDQSIRALYGTGLFEFVEVSLQDTEDGEVNVVFTVDPKFKIERIRFSGAESFSRSRLQSKIDLEAGGFLDAFRVNEAADSIREYYVKKGFANAEVDHRIERDQKRGAAAIVFEIEEGEKIKVADISFQGNEAISDGELKGRMKTKEWNFFLSWLTGDGRFKEKDFRQDLDKLRKFYRDRGYLDVEIPEDKAKIAYPSPGKMDITIAVTEGKRYSLGELGVSGNTIYTENELLGAVGLEPGEPFSPQAVDDAASSITDYYTSRGYLETRVRAEREPNMRTRRIDIDFRIRESEKFFLESIKIDGNTKTKSNVIVRELALRPGEVFDLTRMRTSEKRLKNTRFFKEVKLSPESTNVPGRRDLRVSVDEQRTGNLTFGAGFSSVENAVIFGEVRQSNFDLFNWRSGFQGDGQKFRFRASLGSESNEVNISFEEPWLFEERLAFGVELFRSETEFNSNEFDELRTGFEVFLRQRLFELVEGRLAYRFELVDIFDVDPTGPLVFRQEEGERSVSKMSLRLLRDTRESLIFTREGSRSRITTEVAGGPFGGETDYWKLQARTAQFIPTFDTLKQSVSVIARAGVVTPYGDSDDVPFFDRFFLGGPDSLRGFDFRDVGPRDPADPDEPVGGNSFGLISLEYGFRLAEPLGFVVFYDGGFVNEEEFDFGVEEYRDNWGVGLRVLVLGSPLKLDLGIPITTGPDNDGGNQFNFSFGTRF